MGFAGLGADEEWDMVDSVPGLEPSGIDPAFHSFRYGELEVNVPTGVVQVVVVEVDRAVFVGAQRKGVVPTGPVVAGHALGWSIDRAPVKRMHRSVRGPSRGDVLRKVPIPDQAAHRMTRVAPRASATIYRRRTARNRRAWGCRSCRCNSPLFAVCHRRSRWNRHP